LRATPFQELAEAATIELPTRTPEECDDPRPDSTPAADATPQPPIRLLPPREVPLPDPYEPIPLEADEALSERLRELLRDETDAYAVVVKDLSTGRGVSLNADRVYYAASMFKLFVMYEVFRQQALGLLGWTDQLVMTPYYDGFSVGPRRTRLCQTLTVGAALYAMMARSDNAAAVLLQDLVGAGNVNRAIAALGVSASGIEEALPLTAADVALLLEAVGRGEAVSPQASASMVSLMEREEFDNGLRQALPKDVPLAHKTGNWSNATHDAGIVYADTGPYLIVILSDKDHETKLIREIAEAVYEAREELAR
jgi:beta-lactamase class A